MANTVNIMKIILLMWLLVPTFSTHIAARNVKKNINCKHMSNDEEDLAVCRRAEFMKQLQIEIIKNTILRVLDATSSLDKSHFDESIQKSIIGFQNQTHNQGIFNEEHKRQIFIRTEAQEEDRTVHFKLKRDLSERSIAKAYLNIYIRKPLEKKDQFISWLLIYQNKQLLMRQKFTLNDTNSIDRLHRIDVTQSVQDFLREREDILRASTSTSNHSPLNASIDLYSIYMVCMDHAGRNLIVKKPFNHKEKISVPLLRIEIRDPVISRIRRDSTFECNSEAVSQSCCRFNFDLDFAEFGWHWVKHPKTVRLYFCTGFCQNFKTIHDRVLDSVSCCVPKKHSPLMLIYEDKKNRTTLENIDGLIIDKCGCL